MQLVKAKANQFYIQWFPWVPSYQLTQEPHGESMEAKLCKF